MDDGLVLDCTVKCLAIDGFAHCTRRRGAAHTGHNFVGVRRRSVGGV